jgi:hypothetical protein
VETLRRIYHLLQLGPFEIVQPAVEWYLADRSGYAASRHSVEPPWAGKIRQRWGPYFERYGYSQEDGAVVRDEMLEK